MSSVDPWAELRPLIPEIRAAQKRVTALYEKWAALVEQNNAEADDKATHEVAKLIHAHAVGVPRTTAHRIITRLRELGWGPADKASHD